MELEVKHIAPYLPYGLKIIVVGFNIPNGIINLTPAYLADTKGVKPILHPLSDLTNSPYRDCLWLEDESINYINEYYTTPRVLLCNIDGEFLMYLIENKFDIFGLIEEGLAIDVNELETNPYE